VCMKIAERTAVWRRERRVLLRVSRAAWRREYGLALEEIAGALAQAKVPVTDQERGDMLALARRMKLDDLVPRALGSARVPVS